MSLYTLRTNPSEGLPFIITKFDDSLDVESSYPVGQTTCECPAGHRPICRHRQMLPTLKTRVDTAWFYDFDLKSWSDPTGEANKPAAGDEAEPTTDKGFLSNEVPIAPQAEGYSTSLAPKPAPAFKRRL